MAKERLFVEHRPQGGYAVRRPNSERASAVCSTQAEAIQRARELKSRYAAPRGARALHDWWQPRQMAQAVRRLRP